MNIAAHIEYRPAYRDDVERLIVLLHQVYIQTYAIDGITHEFTNFINQRFSKSYLNESISHNPNQFIVAYYKNNPVGIAEILLNRTCPGFQKELPELSKLYVLERFTGTGVGFGLLQQAELKLKTGGFNELWLEVWQENPRARAFYERQGFSVIGESLFPMSENTYHNFVMHKSLH